MRLASSTRSGDGRFMLLFDADDLDMKWPPVLPLVFVPPVVSVD